jgi:Zn ribbon nucleic-acid-binding protein
MKSKLSKANRTIIENTLNRWDETIHNGQPNKHKAAELLCAAYEAGLGAWRSDKYKKQPVKFYYVSSPVTFMIAMSVVRGRMTKTYATELCKLLEIDHKFLDPLRRDSLLSWNNDRRRWWSNMQNNEFTRTWMRLIYDEYLSNEKRLANVFGLTSRRWATRRNTTSAEVTYKTNNLSLIVEIFRSTLNDVMGLENLTESFRGWDGREVTRATPKTEKKIGELSAHIIWDSSSTAAAIGELNRMVPVDEFINNETADDIDSEQIFLGNVPQAVDAEILCRILKIDDPVMTWEHEVFHHCTAFAAFQRSCIVLTDRPQIALNEAGNIHSTTGPAVQWSDGIKLWYNDGHYMNECGRMIVERNEQLSTTHIMRIRNEETRRLAIERFGWDRFIAEANCPVLDRRINDIDNTTEMLVGPPQHDDNVSRRQNRMVLFCRSTGRRYFIGVPNDILSCEAAQAWMANSGNMPSVAYASQPIRVIGAS